jgi:hypothetical protein
MMAAVESGNYLCVVRWVGRVRMHVEVLTGCGQRIDAANGVVQVPQSVYDGRGIPSISEPRRVLTLCPQCKSALARA